MTSDIPVFGNFQQWFKNKDSVVIDNFIFRLHHQVNFFIVIIGLIIIFAENYFDGNAIQCKGLDAYDTRYCWLHGTGHVHPDLMGKVTPCVNINATEDHNTSITYYIWLPFLLVACLGLAKASRTVWKVLEGDFIADLTKHKDSAPEKVGHTFTEQNTTKFLFYQLTFFFCEILNLVSVFISMSICDTVLLKKFWSYGQDVFTYMMKSDKYMKEYNYHHNPRCELFPTEVSCSVKVGSIVQQPDKSSTICILSNNIFNQHYFFLLWIWWVFLLTISFIGLIYRVARIVMPGFSALMFRRKVGNIGKCNNICLTSGQYFVLNRMADNMDMFTMEVVLTTVEQRLNRDTTRKALMVDDNFEADVMSPEQLELLESNSCVNHV